MKPATRKPVPKQVLVGFYEVPGYGQDSVETDIVGKPSQQYARLAAAIAARHPKAKGIIRLGSKIETRKGEDDYVITFPGMNIGQLFKAGSEAETSLTIGRFFMRSAVWDLVLVQNRAAGHVSVQANSVLKNDGVMRFSNRINPQRSLEELPGIIKEVLGPDVRDLQLRFREKTPASNSASKQQSTNIET